MEVSVVIPTYNRFDALLLTLRALENVAYPTECWEVLVVDDGSTDNTREQVAAFRDNTPINLRYLIQPNAGPARARNLGAKEARGKYLVFIDNDILVQPDFLNLHLKTLTENKDCWVMGRITHPPQLRETPFGRYRDQLHEAFDLSTKTDGVSETAGMTTANVSIPRDDFFKLGGFDEGFSIASCEDLELAIRARNSGVKILYNRNIIGLHNDWAVDLRSYCRRQFLYSVSDVLLCNKYGTASPRVELVNANSYIDWSRDSAMTKLKKGVKYALSGDTGQEMLILAANAVERLAPDTKLSHKFYEGAIGLGIFRGVREGRRKFEED